MKVLPEVREMAEWPQKRAAALTRLNAMASVTYPSKYTCVKASDVAAEEPKS